MRQLFPSEAVPRGLGGYFLLWNGHEGSTFSSFLWGIWYRGTSGISETECFGHFMFVFLESIDKMTRQSLDAYSFLGAMPSELGPNRFGPENWMAILTLGASDREPP